MFCNKHLTDVYVTPLMVPGKLPASLSRDFVHWAKPTSNHCCGISPSNYTLLSLSVSAVTRCLDLAKGHGLTCPSATVHALFWAVPWLIPCQSTMQHVCTGSDMHNAVIALFPLRQMVVAMGAMSGI